MAGGRDDTGLERARGTLAGMFERRLLLVTGKGGTGRSSITAALAIRAARAGRQVLAVAMGDQVGLAAHLGVTALSYDPTECQPGLFAMAIDRSKALDEYLRLQLRMPRLAPLRPLSKSLALFADTVPGIREVITTGKIIFDLATDRWDLIVADGPPTGQIMSYLRAPETISTLVPAGRVQEQAAWMAGTLADPAQTGLLVISVPEELPVTETRETLDELTREPVISVAEVVMNRIVPKPPAAPNGVTLPSGPHRDALALHSGVFDSQQSWLAELPAGPRLPYLFGVHTPGEVAAQLADLLERS